MSIPLGYVQAADFHSRLLISAIQTGELEADEDAFEDHDEYCHGPIDTESNRKDFPEKFFWNCCDNDGTSPGCEEDIHKPSVPRKKRRYE